MAEQISLDAGIRANLFSLKGTAKLLERTQTRLATGKQVNSIIDNATSFFAARNLNDRANDLTNRLDDMGKAVNSINVATAGIDSIRSLLANMKAIVNDAITNNDADQRRVLGDQYNTVLEEAFKIASDSGYMGVNLLSGNQQLVIDFAEVNGSSQLTITGVDVQGQDGNGVSEVTKSVKTTRASTASTGTLGTVSSQASFASVASTASAGSTGSVSSVAASSSVASLATSASQGSVGAIGTIASQASAGSVGSAASVSSVSSSASIAAVASKGTVGSAASQVSIASRSSAASTGSTQSISVTFNQKYAFSLQVSASDPSQTVGIRKAGDVEQRTNGSHRVDFGSSNYINQLNAITKEIDAYDAALATQNTRLSTSLNVVVVRQEFTSALINELKGGADKLTLGDMNEEGANLLALQTRQSLAIQSLSLSAQASQQILRLLA